MKTLNKKIVILTLLILSFLLIGSLGFFYLEGVSFIDSLWYASMTLTTVGYGVPENFSDNGKLFTIFLMLFGVGIFFYAITALAFEILNGALIKEYRQRKFHKKMKNLTNHVIVCGFGRNGRQAVRKLKQYGKKFIVIDTREFDPSIHEGLEDTIYYRGNAIEENSLLQAQIQKASGLITALPSDADNLFVVMTAKQLNPNLKIISRASNSNTISKLKLAGADNVIMPDKIGGEHMASLLVTPDLVEFIDNIFIDGTQSVNMMEIPTHKFKNAENQELRKLNLREISGCSIIGYKDKSNQYIINPDDEQKIEDGSSIILLGRPHQIEKLKKEFDI